MIESIEKINLEFEKNYQAIFNAPKLTQKYLLNRKFNAESINGAKNIIAQEFNPIDDMRASKEYRKKISQNLLERFLHEQNQINTAVY